METACSSSRIEIVNQTTALPCDDKGVIQPVKAKIPKSTLKTNQQYAKLTPQDKRYSADLQATVFAFRPCAHLVHSLSLKAPSWAARIIQILQYPATALDKLICALALPIITATLLCRHYKKCAVDQERKKLLRQIPVKVLSCLVNSVVNLTEGILSLVIPVKAIVSIWKGRQAAKMFAERVPIYHEILKECMKIDQVNPVKILPQLNAPHSQHYLKNICGHHNLSTRFWTPYKVI